MKILAWLYEKKNKKPAPYYYHYSLLTILSKPLRKWLVNGVAPTCPFNCIRILIYRLCGFQIGKHVFIGMRSYLDDMCYDQIKIGNNVWFGGNVTVLAGVTIGDNCVIGAGSVVTKDIPSKVLAVGNPCRVIKEI